MPTPESGGWEELLSAMVGFGAPAESDTGREFARIPARPRRPAPWARRRPHPPHEPPRPAAVHTNVLDGAAHLHGQRVQARGVQGGARLRHQAAPTVPRPRQLGPVRAWLVGREPDLRTLHRLRADRGGAARSLVVVSGFAGARNSAVEGRHGESGGRSG